MLALERDLIACFTREDAAPTDITSTLHQIDEVMRVRGQARLVAWLALTQPRGTVKQQSLLKEVTVALHGARMAIGRPAPFEDTAFAALLASVATFGLAILGPGLLEMMELPNDEATMRRFRDWFAALLMEHGGMPRVPALEPSAT
jgi:hypothetical protein